MHVPDEALWEAQNLDILHHSYDISALHGFCGRWFCIWSQGLQRFLWVCWMDYYVSHNRHQQQREKLELTTIFLIIMIHRLIFQYAPPLASLFFISLPPLVMFELMVSALWQLFVLTRFCSQNWRSAFSLPVWLPFCFNLQIVFVLVFLVIVPLYNPAGNLWNLIEEATIETIQVNTVSQTPTFLLDQCLPWLTRIRFHFVMFWAGFWSAWIYFCCSCCWFS